MAPAGWSEIVQAICFLSAFAFLAILTHCVDDVANIEIEQTVHSARSAFLRMCELLGFKLDMEKSIEPCGRFIYLGLMMILPSAIDQQPLLFCIPEMRRLKLIGYLDGIIRDYVLSPGDASSMRGRLFYYAFYTILLNIFHSTSYTTKGQGKRLDIYTAISVPSFFA